MISVWVYNFLKDEDLCLVDYIPLQTKNDLNLPEVSLCFTGRSPFIQQKLTDFGTNSWHYYYHLTGNNFNESLTKIDYNEITLNLEDYLKHTWIVLKNARQLYVPSSNVTIHVTANDFNEGVLRKCLSIYTKRDAIIVLIGSKDILGYILLDTNTNLFYVS